MTIPLKKNGDPKSPDLRWDLERVEPGRMKGFPRKSWSDPITKTGPGFQ